MRPLTLHEYKQSQHIEAQGFEFYALLAVLMRQADTDNTELLKAAWPDIWESLRRRYNAPGGIVPEWDDPECSESQDPLGCNDTQGRGDVHPNGDPSGSWRELKTIKGHQYWYLRWRDGKHLRSKYIGKA